MTTSDVAQDEVLYAERRGAGLTVAGLLVVMAGISVWAVFDTLTNDGGDPVGRWIAPFVPLGMLAFTAGFSWSRWGPSWRHVVVSRSGVREGRVFLPTGRIGDVRLVESSAARGQTFSGRLGGRRVGYSTYGWMASEGHAVMVEDLEGGRKPSWLFASDDPVGVIEALDLVTGRRRQAFELEVPDPHDRLLKGAERSRRTGRRRYEQHEGTR